MEKRGPTEITEEVQKPVLIIGAGCTGLAIAQGLRKNGIDCIVFEKAPVLNALGSRDWNMGLHWAMPTLRSILPTSLTTHIQSVQVDPNTPTKAVDTLSFLNGRTGEVLSAPAIEYFYRLRRSKFRALLSEGLDIRYGQRLKEIEHTADASTITGVFESGEKVEGRLIIGADGPRSTVRSQLLSSEAAAPTKLPYAATFVQAKYTREQALFLRSFHPLYLAAPHPDGLFAFFGLQDAPKVDEPENWTFFFYISFHASLEQQDKEREFLNYGNTERLQHVKELGRSYTEPWKSAVEWLPDEHAVWYVPLSVWNPSSEDHRWDNRNGTITLAGDAAHPMTFQRGQGLNHSLTDAGKLVDLLTRKEMSQKEAIQQYESEMKSRAGEEVRLSVLNTTMLHDWSKVLESPVVKSGLKAGVAQDK